MNPDIKTLAKLPRGTAWHSRLVAFDQEIRCWREAGESYRQIAAALSGRGLPISHGAVHSYVRARALRKRPMYALPIQVLCHCAVDEKSDGEQSAQSNNVPSLTEEPAEQTSKKYVFQPSKSNQISLSDEDLSFNDPFNLN